MHLFPSRCWRSISVLSKRHRSPYSAQTRRASRQRRRRPMELWLLLRFVNRQRKWRLFRRLLMRDRFSSRRSRWAVWSTRTCPLSTRWSIASLPMRPFDLRSSAPLWTITSFHSNVLIPLPSLQTAEHQLVHDTLYVSCIVCYYVLCCHLCNYILYIIA